jgi:6-phosphofructokinase 1
LQLFLFCAKLYQNRQNGLYHNFGGNIIYMNTLKGALLYGQSGGPTAVINNSFLGVIDEAAKNKCITSVLGADHGISGVLEGFVYDIDKEERAELKLLKTTPAACLGSVRYKLKHFEQDETDYKKILDTFKKFDVRYFFYNGGNDSMDTCNKINQYMKKVGYACRIIGIPKTIDNDLFGTDHCPGYGSAAKYVATACMEIYNDATVYTTGSITIIEVMGRNAGWLTAATSLAAHLGKGPDLIYLPEIAFDTEKFVRDVKKVFDEKRNVLVAISEGIRDKNGKYIAEYSFDAESDMFNNKQLGGAGDYLVRLCKSKIKTKIRAVEFSLLQRCAAHLSSKTDADEAYLAGRFAVRSAINEMSGYMVGLKRDGDINDGVGGTASGATVTDAAATSGDTANGAASVVGGAATVGGAAANANATAGNATSGAGGEVRKYKCTPVLVSLEDAALKEKHLPLSYICENQNFVSQKFLDYALPLIQGENTPPFVNGLPRFAKLKLIKKL